MVLYFLCNIRSNNWPIYVHYSILPGLSIIYNPLNRNVCPRIRWPDIYLQNDKTIQAAHRSIRRYHP
jgi:hypothetical protein